MNSLTLTPALENFIKGFEGCRLHAYQDDAGVWTIGWGSTYWANGTPVKKGDTLVNVECADDLFTHTLRNYAANVDRLVKVPLNDNQYIALVDFEYNTGALAVSTLLKKINAGDLVGADAWFAPWDEDTEHGKKVVNPVLVKRRAAEAKLFLTPIN